MQNGNDITSFGDEVELALLATSLLRWSRWLWSCFGEGGFWQRLRKPKIVPPASKPAA